MLLVPQIAAAVWRVLILCYLLCFGSPVVFFGFSNTGSLYIYGGIVYFACFMLSATSSGEHNVFCFVFSICFSLFFVFLSFIECVCRTQYDDIALHCLLCLLSGT